MQPVRNGSHKKEDRIPPEQYPAIHIPFMKNGGQTKDKKTQNQKDDKNGQKSSANDFIFHFFHLNLL